MDKRPVIGDVIVSAELAYCVASTTTFNDIPDTPVLNPNEGKKDYVVIFSYTAEERVAIAMRTGTDPGATYEANLGRYDQSRGSAEFVVEYANLEGGSFSGMGAANYPDGWHIIARRLTSDGKYDPNGELVDFYYQYYGRSNSIEKLTITRRMRHFFV